MFCGIWGILSFIKLQYESLDNSKVQFDAIFIGYFDEKSLDFQQIVLFRQRMYFDTTNRGSCSRASPYQIAEMNRSRSLDSPRYLSFYLTPIIHRDIRVNFFLQKKIWIQHSGELEF